MSRENLFSSQIVFVSDAPSSHSYYNAQKPAIYLKSFKDAWNRDINILQSGLPSGIMLKLFEDRMDLMSIMITGPIDTPYEGSLFFFDVMLPPTYPNKQPKAKYIPFHDDSSHSQIHPNIFLGGSICLSLLNQSAKNVKRYSMYWMPGKSTLLQLFVSLQGLILAKDPINNISLHGSGTAEESKAFNQTVVKNVILSMTRQIQNPPEMFKEETMNHYRTTGITTHDKLQNYTKGFVSSWINILKRIKVEEPLFPLLTPIPENLVRNFYDALQKLK